MEAEGFWRRDEVAILLTAWRDAADDPPLAATASSSEYTGGGGPAAAPSLDTRVFEHFCAAFGAEPAAPPRSFKSVKKTRKSLLRSFRFIAVFNQNLVIARSMSPLGGTNWFALPAEEQQRVVSAHYKRKPFAFIDENMFEAIELIQAAEDRARRRLMTGRVADDALDEPNASVDHEFVGDDDSDAPARQDGARAPRPARFGGRVDATRALRLARRLPEPHEPETDRPAAPSGRASSSWTREDMLALLQAWEECLDEPRFEAETVAVFDAKVFDRFQELTDGRNLQRSATAVRLKKYSVIPSYQFITDFDLGQIPPVGDPAVRHRPGRDTWFELDAKYRAAVVATYYTKSKYANIEEDMLPTIERIIDKAGPMEPRKGPLANRSPLDDDSGAVAMNDATDDTPRDPWSRHETSLLLHAWSEAETLAQSDPRSGKLKRGLDVFMYQQFCVHCGGESTRDAADVVAHKRALVNTFEFISAFDRDASSSSASAAVAEGEGEGEAPPANWFSLRKGERKRRLRAAARPCTPIDENAFNELRWIFQVRKQAALQSALAAPALPAALHAAVTVPDEPIGHVPPRSILVWSRDEVWNLLNAWTEVLEASSALDESLQVQNDRIFARYLVLNGGSTLRSVKALQAKRDSVITSYHFICDFNDQKIAPPGRIVPGTNWYKLSYEEQKSVIKAFYKKVSFSYLYLDMLPTVKAIIERTPELEVQDPNTYTRKSRQKGWTRDEMDWFLQAWYEAVHVDPRVASESAAAFNSRLHARFLELSDGRSKKPEVTLMTKRRVLTTTYAFVAEFNQRARVDPSGAVVRLNWFGLSEVERKKKMASANKITHTCTTIDEETFVTLHQILGGGKPLELLDVSPEFIPSWVIGSAPRVASPTATMYDSVRVFVGAKRRASAIEAADAASAKRRKPSWYPSSGVVAAFAAAPSIASKTATMYDSVRAFIREIRKPSPKSALASDRRTRSTNLMKRERRELIPSPKAAAAAEAAAAAASLHAKYAHLYKKRQKTTNSDFYQPNPLDTIAALLDKQTELLASMFEQIREERQVEQAERKQLFESILQNQADEQRRNREELAKDRELEKWRWEQIREERRADREQTRQLLEQIMRLHTGAASSTT
ncbi:hypothetical protein PybrP1_006030 [[Pythium] brassicae (nom. inval.)]|nr:hypothetical protein PybrP1_006030 [[Pythium] brassicae (nom. inval.)]